MASRSASMPATPASSDTQAECTTSPPAAPPPWTTQYSWSGTALREDRTTGSSRTAGVLAGEKTDTSRCSGTTTTCAVSLLKPSTLTSRPRDTINIKYSTYQNANEL